MLFEQSKVSKLEVNSFKSTFPCIIIVFPTFENCNQNQNVLKKKTLERE